MLDLAALLYSIFSLSRELMSSAFLLPLEIVLQCVPRFHAKLRLPMEHHPSPIQFHSEDIDEKRTVKKCKSNPPNLSLQGKTHRPHQPLSTKRDIRSPGRVQDSIRPTIQVPSHSSSTHIIRRDLQSHVLLVVNFQRVQRQEHLRRLFKYSTRERLKRTIIHLRLPWRPDIMRVK